MAFKMTKARTRQLSRVRHLLRSFKKRGFEIQPETAVKLRKLTELSTVQLSKITPQYLYKRSTKIVDGERVSGLRGRNIEYIRKAQKAAATRKRKRDLKPPGGWEPIPDEASVIIENFKNIIKNYPTWAAGFILDILETMRSARGDEAVARGLERAPQALKDRIVAFAYNSTEETDSMTRAIVSAMRIIESLALGMASRSEVLDQLHEIAPWKRKRKNMRNPTGADIDWVNKIAEEMEFDYE